ncbi:hypothetical protein GCM10010124_16230 [Pilimelia terevasa]|uniref:ABC transporter n=1 Tax=Pilimelia terevasa TaxID=53372 RepID=A0A8J3BM51_9ACTN|nr:ABC transporter ATP-binding protein [Pilimelia terevasa]GGK24461.1 hypothetical protein GCM10010124_16230 [Pilimelia terevasa]
MRLLRDLWATAPRQVTLLAALIVLDAAGVAVAAALAGQVLVHRSWLAFAAIAVSLAVAAVSHVAVGLVVARLTAEWAADVRRRLCRAALGQPLTVLEGTPVGELLDRIDGDVSQVGAELRGSGRRIAGSLAVGVTSTVAATFVWWPAGLAMAVLAALLVGGLRRRMGAIAPARMVEEEAWSDLAAVMEEAIHGQDDVRTTLARPYVLRLYAQRASQVLARARRVWRLSNDVITIALTVTRLGIAAVIVGGGAAMVAGGIDGSRLTAVWLLAIGFAGTVEMVTRQADELQYALGAWGRVQLLADAAQEPAGGAAPRPGDLAVRGLTFAYGTADGRGPALREVHLTFARGRSYALVGRTGSGKSTLAKILTRAVPVPRGTVFLGGDDILDLDVESLRRWIAVVPQQTDILAGTLVENVALFDPELRTAAVRALDELGLSPWVAGLPDGAQTRLGEGGYVLSAGQAQLVAFARIMVRDPQVVLLDEATARLDPVTETWVHQATDRLLRDRIGIVIAHRLSSVRRCDDVVVLADGAVVEAGPMHASTRFAALLAESGDAAAPAAVPAADGRALAAAAAGGGAATTAVLTAEPEPLAVAAALPSVAPPPRPEPPPARALREFARLILNDKRFGMTGVLFFLGLTVLGFEGSVLPWLWADVVDGRGSPWPPMAAIVVAMLVTIPMSRWAMRLFPEWWVRQMLRISLRLVHGQTGPRRVSRHTPAEVVAQGGDTERVVQLADNLIDQVTCLLALVVVVWVAGTPVPALFFLGAMVISGLAATLFGRAMARAAQRTVGARAAFATGLVSTLSAARTVKLAGATRPLLAHLTRLEVARSDRQRREVAVQVWARSTPGLASSLLPIGAWAMYLHGGLSPAAVLITVAMLGSAGWFAWTTASVVSALPSARVWTRRTVDMVGEANYSADVPGVDIAAGTAAAPAVPERMPLQRLELVGFSAVHDDGRLGVRDVELTVRRGQLVLVLGPVGSGKSSLLRALAGIVHHTGALRWNSRPVTEPELFLRPNQVAYVGQVPRVLSGTLAENIALGREVDAATAVAAAQLEHDLAGTGQGLELVIGHKGTRLSGGQLQRVALARALAARAELLVADDVSSALDVTTELELWRALRAHGVTVVGSTSKRAALQQADHVVVLVGGEVADQGPWTDLAPRWGHFAG